MKFWLDRNIVSAMRRQTWTAGFVVMLITTSPMLSYGSGSVTTTRVPSRDSLSQVNLNATRPASTPASQMVVAEEPYTLGKSLFSGKYTFGKPKLTAANIGEKMQRLVALQSVLPAHEQKKINPSERAKQLTNREMNALEYYVGVRFGKVIAKPPSWAKEEPPPKIASSR